MRDKQKYFNPTVRQKAQPKAPPPIRRRVPFQDARVSRLNRDAQLRKQFYKEAQRVKAPRPKRFSKWLMFLFRILRLDNDL